MGVTFPTVYHNAVHTLKKQTFKKPLSSLQCMNLKLIAGRANPALAQEVSELLNIPLTPTIIKEFKDDETYVRIGESIRGDDCFIIQPTCRNVNQNLMELLIMIDALKRASAKRITAVIPYFGYSRQDRKAISREPITAKLVANLIGKAGADRVLTVDLHSEQVQGFFDMPVDVIQAFPVKVEYIYHKRFKDLIFVSPDVGAVRNCRRFAKIFDAPIAIVDKRRVDHNKAEVMHIIGEVKDKNCVLVDDMIDTGGTICEASRALKERGAKSVHVCVAHPVFSDKALQLLNDAPIEEVIVTNTIPIPQEKMIEKVKVLSIAPMIAEAIRRIHNDETLDALFSKAEKFRKHK